MVPCARGETIRSPRRLAWLAGLALAATAVAQRQPGGIRITDVGGELGLESEYWDEQSRSSTGLQIDRKEWVLREVAGFGLDGDIYHPALLTFSSDVKFGLAQRGVEGDAGTPAQHADEQSIYYDVRATMFRDLPVNGEVYAWRNRLESRQRFFATSRADADEWGANVRLRDLWIPSQLHYDRYTYSGRGRDDRRERRERMRASGSRFGDHFALDYTIEHNDVEELSFDRSYRELVGRGSYTQRFGGEDVDFLRLSGSSRDRQGDLDSSYVYGAALLHLQWADTFFSEHGVQIDESQVGDGLTGRRDNLEYFTTLRHRLYESLETGVTGRLTETDLGLGRIDRVQVDADVRYHKKTPFGAIGLTYDPRWYEQEEVGFAQLIPVVDESHVFTLGVPILLQNVGVFETSIVVADVANTTVYATPIDYLVTQQDGRTRLDIPVGSRILPGQTIVVDYAYSSRPDKKFTSTRHSVGLMFEFDRFASLEFAYGDEQQELITGTDSGDLGNSRYRLARARIYQSDHELGADYEDRDSAFAPYERTQYHGRSMLELGRDKRLVLQGLHYRTRFKGAAESERGSRFTAAFDWQVGVPTRVYARTELHTIDYRSDSGTGWLLEGGFQYRVRNLEVMLDVGYTHENFEVATDQDLLYAHFQLRRIF